MKPPRLIPFLKEDAIVAHAKENVQTETYAKNIKNALCARSTRLQAHQEPFVIGKPPLSHLDNTRKFETGLEDATKEVYSTPTV